MPDPEIRNDPRTHWQAVYARNAPEGVSWHASHLTLSVDFIRRVASQEARVIDIGGGHSALVDDLLQEKYSHLAVLDISETALDCSRKRLGQANSLIQWLVGDVLSCPLPGSHFDVWHDRAVFHFLTQPEQRTAYVSQLSHALKPGGHVVMATFGPDGPMQCSGLATCRYDPDSLAQALGSSFHLVESAIDLHQTPLGTQQQFLYCLFCCR